MQLTSLPEMMDTPQDPLNESFEAFVVSVMETFQVQGLSIAVVDKESTYHNVRTCS